ncbi:hypothetical protein SAMN05444156_0623 [Verrucomicrobium sp. GAS474]|uniref:hypothetical protein n=1 Tax=Verrucomicrobium sp. GAS474 TaxID=1882831 RepID=UPI00087AD7B6|nr:hypothetical protein [Verrucomicrobium sp. GAS474]SDT90686.1 hypothetical protein SAMN05444156_0623 [Verrucomicrobium sp. GAS474]
MKTSIGTESLPIGDPSTRKKPFVKAKAGFWAPADVQESILALVENGTYADQSKAIVGLLRKALRDDTLIPPPLRKRLDHLSTDLDRTPEAIVRLCVEGILEMLDGPEATIPLLIEEVRLRQRRGQNGT